MEVRPARPADREAIRRVQERAFGHRTDEANLVEAPVAAERAPVSLAATRDGRMVAHLLFSVVTLEPQDPTFRAVGLGPLAVLPECQRQGIGTQLVRVGLDACRAARYGAVFVLGHPDYYPRFGFQRASAFGLGNDYGADDAFMVLFLTGHPWGGPAGTVTFAPQFAATGC